MLQTQIRADFPTCDQNSCLIASVSTVIEVFDPKNSKCYFVEYSDANSNFTVQNPSAKEIFFLAIDKCIFSDADLLKRCDFALFDDSIFCFIEIKDTQSRRKTHKDKSFIQLKTTINEFISRVDFSGYLIEAIISWRYIPKRPLASTKMQSKKLEFKTLFNAILYEGNQKAF
jgi:hypothetical protein